MDYFSDIQFVCSGYSRNTTCGCKNRIFDYYGVQFICDGQIFVDCEGVEPWQADGPVLFITGPGRKFSYFSPHNGREHFYVCFKGDRVQRYIESGLLPPIGEKISITAASEMKEVMDTAVRLLRNPNKYAHGNAVLSLEKILLMTSNQPAVFHPRAFNRNLIRKIVEEIAEHPEKNWNIGSIAEEYKLSQVHFRRLFQTETGAPPNNYILMQRIRYASMLLQTTDMRIKEIAFASGFNSEFYFSRQFKKYMKKSPSEFRGNI